MKTMLIMCGAGHATSTVVRSKVDRWLDSEGLRGKVEVKQSAVGREVENIAQGVYDVVVSTTQVPKEIQDRVINGISLLTGVGSDRVFAEIKAELER